MLTYIHEALCLIPNPVCPYVVVIPVEITGILLPRVKLNSIIVLAQLADCSRRTDGYDCCYMKIFTGDSELSYDFHFHQRVSLLWQHSLD